MGNNVSLYVEFFYFIEQQFPHAYSYICKQLVQKCQKARVYKY